LASAEAASGSSSISTHERRVGEIGQEPVRGEDQLTGVVAAEAAGVHLRLEERDPPIEGGLHLRAEPLEQDRAPVEGLPRGEAHERHDEIHLAA
jgi:hypothetical protein